MEFCPSIRFLQVNGSHNEEDTGGGSILRKDDGTEDLDSDQPEYHYIDRWLVSLGFRVRIPGVATD